MECQSRLGRIGQRIDPTDNHSAVFCLHFNSVLFFLFFCCVIYICIYNIKLVRDGLSGGEGVTNKLKQLKFTLTFLDSVGSCLNTSSVSCA